MREELYYLLYHGITYRGHHYTTTSSATRGRPLLLQQCLSYLPGGQRSGLDYFTVSESQYERFWRDYIR